MYAAKNGADSRCSTARTSTSNDPSLLSLMGELREAHRDRPGRHRGRAARRPVQDGRVVSAEALVRWHHPVRGTLRPGLFLPLAERNGLIVPLTTLVLERAVAACAAWRAEGLELSISVNLSARSLLDTMLPTAVADDAARGTACPATC